MTQIIIIINVNLIPLKRLSFKKLKTNHLVQNNVNKRKANDNNGVSAKRIKLTPALYFNETPLNEPKGLIWDGENYSCAYDALFSVLWNIWLADPTKWTTRFATLSERMGILGQGFEDVGNGILTIERIRNNIRQDLHHHFPDIFPYGHRGTSVAELANKMFHNVQVNASSQLQCMNCDLCDDSVDDQLSPVIYGIPNIHVSATVMEQLQTTLVTESRQVCTECTNPLTNVITYHHFPKLLIFSIGGYQIEINKFVKVRTNGGTKKFYLKGIVYHGGFHFVSRIVEKDNTVWFHDGQLGRGCIYEKMLEEFSSSDLHMCSERIASLVIYAQN
jgi:hypothetical protein